MKKTAHLTQFATRSTSLPYGEIVLNGKLNLRLHVQEAQISAWFAAAVRLDTVGAQHNIKNYTVIAQVGLDGDAASYPCHLRIDSSASRHIETKNSNLEEAIAESIQAVLLRHPHFADFLQQRMNWRTFAELEPSLNSDSIGKARW